MTPLSMRLPRLRLAVVHRAAPSAVLDAAALDVLLELLDALFDAPAQEAERIADVLRGALRLVSHDQSDQRALGADRLETDCTRIRRVAGDALPADLLLGDLLRVRGIPFLVVADGICV